MRITVKKDDGLEGQREERKAYVRQGPEFWYKTEQDSR